MKILLIMGLLSIMILNSCTSQTDCMAPPPSITFNLLGKSGNDLSSKHASDFAIIYTSNGQEQRADMRVTVEPGTNTNRVYFFSYFPSLVEGGITDFTLKLNSGYSYPIKVTLGQRKDKCSSAPIEGLEFDGNQVDIDTSIQPNLYSFVISDQ